MNLRPVLAALVAALVGVSAAAESPEEAATIGRKLEEMGTASTFIKLLKNTDKAEALLFAPKGATTVFVPTNEAFAAMDDASRAKLLDPSNKHWLERVLTYHAVHGSRVDGYVLQQVGFVQNGLGQYLTIDGAADGALSVDGARVVQADLACSNGLVHFIDRVLDPVEYDLFERLEDDGRFTVLTKLIKRSGLTKLFQNRHKVYTVFAPTDEAFKTLPAGTVDSLMSPEKLDLLSDVIRSHIVEGVWTVGKTLDKQPLGTPGFDVRNEYQQTLVFRNGDYPTIDRRRIVTPDLVTRNGFLHILERPLEVKRESLVDVLVRAGRYTKFLELCKLGGMYDQLGQFGSQVTVFAPTDEYLAGPRAAGLSAELRASNSQEVVRGLLQRHFVTGRSIFVTNAIGYQRFNSNLDARIDLVRDGGRREVQGVPIVQADMQARNGVAHGIDGVIPYFMEPTDSDQYWQTYRNYVAETLATGSALYGAGKLREATEYYAQRNYEFTARYGGQLKNLYGIQVSRELNNDLYRNRRYDFASTAWRQRNGFRNLLRSIESKRPLLIDELRLRAGLMEVQVSDAGKSGDRSEGVAPGEQQSVVSMED